MSTQAQVAANRCNAQHSTGPTTDQGKASSCLNNFRHGFCSAFVVLDFEDREAYDMLLCGLRADHQPASVTESILVEKMAQHHWLSQRAVSLQNEALSDPQQLTLFLRYQTTHSRAFHKCLNDLLKLRAEKRRVEIGFESQERKRNEESRKQAAEQRKQDAHKTKLWMLQAQAEHQELLNFNLETPESRILGRVERILARLAA